MAESVPIAQRLRSPNLVVLAGDEIAGRSRAEQHAAIASVLTDAACVVEGPGLTLLLEPLNSRVDHVGTFLDRTAEGLAILREVASPGVKLLFDAYHALLMDEDIARELSLRLNLAMRLS